MFLLFTFPTYLENPLYNCNHRQTILGEVYMKWLRMRTLVSGHLGQVLVLQLTMTTISHLRPCCTFENHCED